MPASVATFIPALSTLGSWLSVSLTQVVMVSSLGRPAGMAAQKEKKHRNKTVTSTAFFILTCPPFMKFALADFMIYFHCFQ